MTAARCFRGRKLPPTRIATPSGIKSIADMLRETAQKAGVELSGIGIGSTGPVDPIRGEFGDVDFLPGWRGKSPVRDLEAIFNVRVALENDGDAAALAEAGWGAGRNRSRLIYVTVGTGIGGGIILDGKLYRGVDGAHPEVGHHVIDPCWSGVLVRISRLLGITGRRSGDGGVDRKPRACRLSASPGHYR